MKEFITVVTIFFEKYQWHEGLLIIEENLLKISNSNCIWIT